MTSFIKVDRIKSSLEYRKLLDVGVSAMCLDCGGLLPDDRSLKIAECMRIVDECGSELLGIKINPSITSRFSDLNILIDYARGSFLQIDYNYLDSDWLSRCLPDFDRNRLYIEGIGIDCDEKKDYIVKELLISHNLGIRKYIIGLYEEFYLDWSNPEAQTELCETPWQEAMSLISKYDLFVQSDFINYSTSKTFHRPEKLNLKLGRYTTASQIDIKDAIKFVRNLVSIQPSTSQSHGE
ncbi:hypothetical protein MF271_22135 (plasmid) [Deinococcus sp. KNUC1210]|uniref:hypothetical protein n=1 Tax=Deinococcus sp. KNUC1210 TaxID=2917691 RepID=UPI001EF14D37|nr:hypothetical protein [Deinococcus sp. KNUC1210]ULH18176.1 hypothetical protein MF271_22135 [Deinococcus sp. KNUC1210]